jgi:hypothetical protein
MQNKQAVFGAGTTKYVVALYTILPLHLEADII